VKMTIPAAVVIAAMIVPALAQEKVIVRRAAACIEQEDVFEFYKLSHEKPSMGQLTQFLRDHQCMALKSGDRVKIEREDSVELYYCVRVPERTPCYWIRRSAFKR
jgi:hypothetical protein